MVFMVEEPVLLGGSIRSMHAHPCYLVVVHLLGLDIGSSGSVSLIVVVHDTFQRLNY